MLYDRLSQQQLGFLLFYITSKLLATVLSVIHLYS